MPRLLIATGNVGKLREYRALLDDLGWELGTGIIVPPIVFGEDRLVVVTRGGIVYVLRLLERDDDFEEF